MMSDLPPSLGSDPAAECFSFKDKVVLITGASAGCGLEMAFAFARRQARVVLVARRPEPLEAAVEAIRGAGGDARAVCCDVTDAGAVRHAIHELSRLDVLINNAGTNIPEPFLDVSESHLDQLTRLNMRAPFVVAQAAIAKMRQRADLAKAGGVIINVTSQMGHIGAPERVVYCMTKHGVEGLTKALAIELAGENIRVNSIAPTFVDTPLIRRIVDTPAKQAALVSRIPMGRMATVTDIANGVLYLASPAAAMVTGTSLIVDGGWTAQ